MKTRCGLVFGVCMLFALMAHGQSGQSDPLLESVKKGCEKDLVTYCKDVTPGEGRSLACLYAYQDKLSNRCEYALYDASSQLQRAVAALTFVGNECEQDLAQHCTGIKPGEGRIRQCLKKNEKQVSDRCKKALQDVGAQ